MSDSSPHQYLYQNLVILNELKPGGPDFVKCIKDDMFTKPNRTAFDQVLFYLCNAYDSARYMTKVPWPILDRSQERAFRQNSVTFVKEIIKDFPEARIPQFSPSFLSTPGGERLAKFMWKFSLFVLKTLTEREGDVIGFLQYPSAPAVLPLVENITEEILQDIGKDSNDLCQLIIDASKYAKKMNNDISNHSMEINRLKSELTDILQSVPHCPLTEKDKSLLLSCDREQFLSIINQWQSHLNKDAAVGKLMLQDLEDQSNVIKDCYNSVQALVNNKTMPVVLDASNFPANLKDNNGNVDLAHLLSEGARTASNLTKSLSMFGGFQRYDMVLPELESIRKQLQEAENSFAETKAGFIELLAASLENMRSPKDLNGGTESPTVKGGLQLGNEMLLDVQTNTPPMVFDVRCDMSSRISTESSPILIGNVRPFPRKKACVEAGSTPKAAVSNSSSGLLSRNLSGRVSQFKSFSQKDHRFLKGSPKLTGHETMCNVLETPANFCPKKFATSTACKPTIVPASYKSKLGYVEEKINVLTLDKNNSLQTVNESSSSKIPNIQSGAQRATSAKTVSKVVQSSTSLPEGKECNSIFLQKKEKSNEVILKEPTAKEESFKKLGPLHNVKNTDVPSTKQTTKKDLYILSPVTKKEASGMVASSLKPGSTLKTSQEVNSGTLSSPLHKTPLRSKPIDTNKSVSCSAVPKILINAVGESSLETFDSPQSSSFGGLSPTSPESSFFSSDIAIGEEPKFELDDFADDISPSGRVSLCPPDFEAKEAIEEELAPAKNSSRRKSLQAIIHRYRELVASSKQHKVEIVSPSSPEVEATDEDCEDLETSFSDQNLL